MSTYILTFRNDPARTPTPEQEKLWADWFAELGERVTDFGNRVGRAVMVGDDPAAPDQLSGYVAVEADDLDSAVKLASGCPGLTYGGRVEVGEPVPMS
ncbi:YciI family protein [Nocardia niigatensis]|uniref:YciI family protein n=1 Tax=Nocardia niigatensis TaxID=209249 RepID=UPI00031281D2|nr:YciI family protein [Nocardia niigatensis]